MNLSFKKEDVLEGFIKVSNIVPSKSGSNYIKCVWIQAKENKIILMGNDINIEFTGKYDAIIIEEGYVGVNAKAIVELIRKLPTDKDINFKLDLEKNILIVSQGRKSYKLPIADPVWFQPLASFPEDGHILWAGDYFKELLDKISFCIHDDESQEYLACLYINNVIEDKIDICGLNSHQFAMVRFINETIAEKIPENGLLILKKYVNEIKKWMSDDEINFNLNDRRFYLRNGKGTEHISLPRANFNFSEYLDFIERLKIDGATKLYLDRKECIDALNRLSIFNSENDKCTYFKLDNKIAILSAQAQDTGSAIEELDIVYEGVLEKIAFPTKNLIEILEHFKSEKLEFIITGSEGPCGISGTEDPGYLVLIMPMKIAETSYYDDSNE